MTTEPFSRGGGGVVPKEDQNDKRADLFGAQSLSKRTRREEGRENGRGNKKGSEGRSSNRIHRHD